MFVELLGHYGVFYDPLCISLTFEFYVKTMKYT